MERGGDFSFSGEPIFKLAEELWHKINEEQRKKRGVGGLYLETLVREAVRYVNSLIQLLREEKIGSEEYVYRLELAGRMFEFLLKTLEGKESVDWECKVIKDPDRERVFIYRDFDGYKVGMLTLMEVDGEKKRVISTGIAVFHKSKYASVIHSLYCGIVEREVDFDYMIPLDGRYNLGSVKFLKGSAIAYVPVVIKMRMLGESSNEGLAISSEYNWEVYFTGANSSLERVAREVGRFLGIPAGLLDTL